MKSHKVLFEKTAHYFTLGEANKETKYFCLVTHGYGQLASRFIYKFDQLDLTENFILAPEGLSRFYWKRSAPNPVGASWMTKENRLDEIADYTRYIKKLYEEYKSQMSADVKIIMLGFSQGCATQMRWITREFPDFDHLILWAGLLPEDLDYTPHQDYFSKKNLKWVYGNEDEFLKEKHITWHQQFMQEQSLDLESIEFAGKHVIDRKILKEVFEKIKDSDT